MGAHRCAFCGRPHAADKPHIPCKVCGKIHNRDKRRCRKCGYSHHSECVCRGADGNPVSPDNPPIAPMESPDTKDDGGAKPESENLQPTADTDSTMEGAAEGVPSAVSPEPKGNKPLEPLPPPPPKPEDLAKTGVPGVVVPSKGGVTVLPKHIYTIGVSAKEIVGFTGWIGEMCETKIIWTDDEMDELNFAFAHDPALSKLGLKTENGALYVAYLTAKKTVPPIIFNFDKFSANIGKKFAGIKKFFGGIGGKIGGLFGRKPEPPKVQNRDGAK